MLPTVPRRLVPAAALALTLALAACNERTQFGSSPLNRFIYPTSVALRHVVPGTATPCAAGTVGIASQCQTQLLVASSNGDLRYDPSNGGSVIAMDVAAALDGYDPGLAPAQPLNDADTTPMRGQLGGAHVASFTGELAVVDAATCPGWTGVPQALVTSRSDDALYRLVLDDAGRPQAWDPAATSCAQGCRLPLHGPTDPADGSIVQEVTSPYGVTVVCGNFPDSTGALTARALAFLSYLEVELAEGGVTQLDLTDASPPASMPLVWRDLGVSPVRSAAFDPVSTRLFLSAGFGAYGLAPVRWITMATPLVPFRSYNLEELVIGSEPRALALSSDRSRLYVALRLFDTSAARTASARPIDDIGGALAVLDLVPAADGLLGLRAREMVPLDRGASEVRVIPRSLPDGTALPDLVAVVSEADGRLSLYDEALGAVVHELGVCPDDSGAPATPGGFTPPEPCEAGLPSLGIQPAGLAVEVLARAADAAGRQLVRLYVASFDQSWVNVITFDALHPEQGPTQLVPAAAPGSPAPAWARLGPERLW